MAKSSNQKLKILYILQLLWEKSDEDHPVSMGRILEELERRGICAERKSIYDDMEALRYFGMDICQKKGRDAGYFLVNRPFEVPELKMLIDSVQASRFLTEKKSRELIRKLNSLCSEHEACGLRRQLYVSNRSKSANERIFYNVDQLHEAIGMNRSITFRYFQYDVNKKKQYRRDGARYEVSPFALIWDNENYYLVAYDHADEKIKHYRVDKMEEISRMEESRRGQAIFEEIPMENYTNTNFSMFGGEIYRVELCFSKDLVNVVLERFGQDISLYRREDGSFVIHPEVAISPQFFGWLFALEGKAVLLGPEIVREKLQAYIERFSKVHER